MTSEDDVRRLLAALDEHDRHDPPPLPDDVAARLDAELAGLARHRAQEPVAAVVPLRRRGRTSLAAAAAVVLLAGGGVLVAGGLLTGGSGDDAASEAGGSAAGAPEAADEDSPRRVESPESAVEDDSLRTPGRPPQLQRGGLSGQVQQLVEEGTLRLDPSAAVLQAQSTEVRSGGCEPPDAEGALLGVRYDAARATLVVGDPDGDARDVRVYSCAGDEVLVRTQVPADLSPR